MKPLKGLYRDCNPIDQPEGTYRDALNALLNDKQGAVSNEGGALSVYDLITTGGYTDITVLGYEFIYDGRIVIFFTDDKGASVDSVIGVLDTSDDSFTEVLNESSLSFSTYIDSDSTINDKSEVVVYWTDDLNPPRYYNIDAAEAVTDITTLNLFPTIADAPEVSLDNVNPSGGSLLSGAYHFGIALYAEDGSRSNYMSVTPPVYINDDGDPASHDTYDGVVAGTSTSKAIRLDIANLDTNYDEYELVVIRKEAGSVAEVSKLPKQRITSESAVLNYTGNEETVASSLSEVLTNTASYETAKTITEQDDSLYLGNLSKKPDIGYQKYANNITIESVVADLDDGGAGLQDKDHYGNPVLSFYDKSFKRGEVYAFYISFVLENGQDSQAYHIPGRAFEGTEKDDQGEYLRYQVFGDKGTNGMGFWENKDETYPSTDDFDVYDVDANGDPDPTGTDIKGQNVRHHRFPDASETAMGFWEGSDNSPHAKKLGIKVSDIKIPKNILSRVRAVKISYARRDSSNQIILDQGIGVPMKYAENSPAGQDDRAWMYLRGPNHSASDDESSDGVIFDSFNALRTRKNIGAASYLKEVGQPEGPSLSDGDGDPEQVFFNMSEKMYYGSGVYPIKAITYLEHASYVSGRSKGFSYNIDNTVAEEGMAIEFDGSFQASWDGVGDPWGARDVDAGLSQTAVGRVFELVQVLDNVYFPFDQQELVWTGIQINDIDLFDPRTTGGSSGSTASGSLNITGDADPVADYAEAVLEVDTTKPANGHIEVTANSIQGTEDHTINVDGNTTAPITIEGQPGFLQSLDISTQSIDPYSIYFRDDGSTMYILSRTGDEVDEYALSTPWDISTATYTDSFDVSTQDTSPDAVDISNVGTKMYITGSQNSNVYEYDLSTAWDVSTATFLQSFDISTETTNPKGFHMKSDGSQMWVLDGDTGIVYEYNLSVAFDVTTATVGNSYDASAQDASMTALTVGNGGNNMYLTGTGNDSVYEYSLGTAHDITTASLVATYVVSDQDTDPEALFWKPDGLKFYMGGLANDDIYEYDANVAWSLDTADSVQDIVTKYRDAINADGTISTDWTATIEDQGGGVWRAIVTSNARGTSWNGRTVDVTGETDVTLTTANTAGGQDFASAGDIGVQFNSPHGLFEISVTLSGGEDSDQVASLLSAEFDSELVFSLFYDSVVDTGPVPPTITITSKSNGTYMNTDIVLNTGTTNVLFTKDGEIDGGADNGSFDFRQSIGYLEVVSVDTTGNIDVSMPLDPSILVNVAVDTSNSVEQTAQDIATNLEAATQLDEYDFFAYEDRVYYYDPGNFEYDGDEATVADDTGSVTANTTPITNGRVADGDFDKVSVIVSTPAFAGSIDVSITPGDTAANIENDVLAALQGWSAFNSHFSASGTDPIAAVSDQAGSEYNGVFDLDPKGTGVTYTASNFSGGVDPEATDFTISEVYGGDTYIALYGTRRSMWDTDGDDEAFRHLIYFPCESQDNIKLRHAGEGYGETYYPKGTYDEIISFELDAPSEEDTEHYNNYIAYNLDYSAQAVYKTPIPFSKDADTVRHYPTRAIRSAQGDSTEGDTGIRTFLENDYLDFTRSKGELVKLAVVQNTLIAHMERSLIKTKGREELVTSDFRAYLGAGDIFSVKPDEMYSTKTGYGGLQDPKSAVVTPYGYFFVDRKARKVFMVSNQPEEISNKGMRNFFQEELDGAPSDSLISTWDDEHDRVILTYKGNWTISYYPILGVWGSFHDYDPDCYFYGLNDFYSVSGGVIYKHNDDTDPGTFYGTTYPFELQFVENRSKEATKILQNVQFITRALDQTDAALFKETFDEVRITTDFQDSGDITLIYFDQANGNLRNVRGTWKVNKFRDMLNDAGVVDANLPWYEQKKFIDKYFKVRLTYNNSANNLLYLTSVDTGVKLNIR